MGDTEDAVRGLARVDGVVVTGGDDVNPDRYRAQPAPETKAADPARDEFEIALINAAVRDDRAAALHLPRHPGDERRAGRNVAAALRRTLRSSPATTKTSTTSTSSRDRCWRRSWARTQVGVNSLHHQALDVIAPDARCRRPQRRRPCRRRRSRRGAASRSACSGTPSCCAIGRTPRTVRGARRRRRVASTTGLGRTAGLGIPIHAAPESNGRDRGAGPWGEDRRLASRGKDRRIPSCISPC